MSVSRSPEPALGDLLALAAASSAISPARCALQVLGDDGDAALLGELVEREARRAGSSRKAAISVSKARLAGHLARAPWLVGEHRAVPGGGDELGRVVDARRRSRAPPGVGGEAPAASRAGAARPRGSRAGGDEHELVARQLRDVGRRALARLDRARSAPRGAGSPPSRRPRAPPRGGAAGRAAPSRGRRAHAGAVGLARALGLEVDVDGTSRTIVASCLESARRRRARSGSACAWRPRSGRRWPARSRGRRSAAAGPTRSCRRSRGRPGCCRTCRP
jgi:hypothetical protein